MEKYIKDLEKRIEELESKVYYTKTKKKEKIYLEEDLFLSFLFGFCTLGIIQVLCRIAGIN